MRTFLSPDAKEHRTPVAGSAGSWHLPWRMEDHVKFSSRRSPVAKAVRVLEFYVPSFGAVLLSGAPSADDACCSATPLHGSGLSSGAPVAATTSAGVMRAHFGARYTWPRRCCAGCCTAVADHLLLETMGCAAVGRSFVMSSNSTEAGKTYSFDALSLTARSSFDSLSSFDAFRLLGTHR